MLTRAALPAFLRDQRAVSAIEFAIWAPVMCLLFLGSVDLTRYAMATGRLSDVADTIGQMLSVNDAGTVTYIDLQFYHDSAMVIYPQVLADAAQQQMAWSNDLQITLSSITFTATPSGCTTNCTYVPKLLWTSGSNKRSCTVAMTSASDSALPSSSTLPADTFGPTSLLVVDIAYTYRSFLSGALFHNMTIKRSYYTTPRYVTTVNYTTVGGDPGTTTVCP